MKKRSGLLLDVMNSAFTGHSWHGTTLRGTLRGVTPARALKRPAKGRHCIWDYVLHTAYWKYAVRRRLEGEAAGSFPRRPANWPKVPGRPDAAQWRKDVTLLEEQHRMLMRLAARLGPARLRQRSPKGAWRNVEQLYGVAAHDLYHAGQIQLIKKLV